MGESSRLEQALSKMMKLPKLHFFDDKAEEPVAIYRHIGKRPVAAFGSSDGDFEMLEYTDASKQ